MYSASFSRLSSGLIWGRVLLGKTCWNRAGAVGCTASQEPSPSRGRREVQRSRCLVVGPLAFPTGFPSLHGGGALLQANLVRQRPQQAGRNIRLRLGSHRFLGRIQPAMKVAVQFQWLAGLLPSGQCAGLGSGLVEPDFPEPGWCSWMHGIAGTLALQSPVASKPDHPLAAGLSLIAGPNSTCYEGRGSSSMVH